MPTKKKQQTRPDYLKLSAMALLVVMLVVNVYTWWSPNDPLNMISTTAASLAWGALIPVVLLSATVFWIFMLIDAWQRSKFLWFLFILVGQGLIGLLYFLVEQPKIIRENARLLGWIALVSFAVFWALFTAPNLKTRISPPPDTAPFVSMQGTVVSKDVNDGPGVYVVDPQGGGETIEIHVGPTDSCDDEAVTIRDELEVGDTVLFYAKQYNSDDSYASVCAAGTYIDKL